MEKTTTVSKFSFSGTTSPTTPNAGDNRQASDGQVKFYLDLCTQKKVEPDAKYVVWSFSEMRDAIEVLKAYYPASDRQIELIHTKVANLHDAGVDITIDFDNLSGGLNGTASQIINHLIELEKKYVRVLPTDAQLNLMVQMYPCESIDFESYGIMRVNEEKIRLTPDAFAEEITKNMSKDEASAFIDKFRADFNEWRSTRVRPKQLAYIKTLMERNGSPIDEIELLMMSGDTASQFIDQLVKESKTRPAQVEGEKLSTYQKVSSQSQLLKTKLKTTFALPCSKSLQSQAMNPTIWKHYWVMTNLYLNTFSSALNRISFRLKKSCPAWTNPMHSKESSKKPLMLSTIPLQ